MSIGNKQFVRRMTLGIVLLSFVVSGLPLAGRATRALGQNAGETPVNGSDGDLSYVKATARRGGVQVEWRSKADPNNLGFNLYRLQSGKSVRINTEVIPGAIFAGVNHITPPSAYGYSRLDPAGQADSIYYIESISVDGQVRTHNAFAANADTQTDAALAAGVGGANPTIDGGGQFQKQFPAGANVVTPSGPIEDQWNVAAQPSLKISIKSDGWYRVTQQQMAATGFASATDIANLALFSDGREVAILTSKDVGQFSSGDYIEFFGRGLDTSTTDTRIYYLIAGASPGKRISGEVKTSSVLLPAAVGPQQPVFDVGVSRWFRPLLQFLNGSPRNTEEEFKATKPEKESSPPTLTVTPPVFNVSELPVSTSDSSAPNKSPAVRGSDPVSSTNSPVEPAARSMQGGVTIAAPRVKAGRRRARRQSTRKAKRRTKPELSHADATTAAAAAGSFNSTVEFKHHFIYYTSLLNGDTENYFGNVVSSIPVPQTLNVPNPEPTADGPARLEIAIQGVLGQSASNHIVNVSLNGALVTTLNFGPLEHYVRTINIPVSQLLTGANTVTFTRVSSGDVTLIDYVRLTYPHAMKADNNALRFSLRSAQAATIDGFAGQNIRLIDVTDPFAVKAARPLMQATPSGYSISVSPGAPGKYGRQLYAFSETQFVQPAALALNQASTLNLASNAADLLIIAHKSLIGSAAPLVSLRQSQGLTVSVVDIEDVYDEFSYGAHGPQAIKDFLLRAKTSWTTKPRYVIFLGDASLDPRNYEGLGDFDLVPTKLVDATYNETASDDWLSDFNNDGIGDIPSGRLPVRTVAEANLAISKIVNFAPNNAPQNALLVADDPTNYYYNFEIANDEVQAQLNTLIPSMTVDRVNKRLDPNAHTNIVNKLNQGQALINYSGHGNVNTWTGSSIFTSTDASAATNGNKLPLVLVLNCLNGYFQDPRLESIAEALLKAPNGGAVGVFASSGETIPDGQHDMNRRLYVLLYSTPTTALGDAVKDAKGYTTDIDVRRTWILFGDPSMKIR